MASPTTTTPSSSGHAAPSLRLEAIGPGSLRIVDRFPLPGDGDVIDGPDGLWTLDRHDRKVVDGVPAGSTFKVDPGSGAVLATVPHAIGGRMSQGFGAIWMATVALDRVTRIDLRTHAVRLIESGIGPDAEPESIAFGGGSVWVGNNHQGTVARIDPTSGKVVTRIPVSDPGPGGVRVATSDDERIWFGESRSGMVMRIDPATEAVVQRIGLPGGNVESLELDGHILWASDGDHLDQVDTDSGSIPSRIALQPGAEAINLVRDGRDLWVLTIDPNALLRVNLDTATVTERLDLSSFAGRDAIGAPTGDLAVRQGIVWDRIGGYLLKITHD